MNKGYRQGQILKLIRSKSVHTQEEIAKELKSQGIGATQVTLSRDIRELGLVKVSDDGVHPRYAPVETVAPPIHTKPEAIVARLVRRVGWSGNLLVVKTDPGEASPVGIAIDRLGWP